MSLAYEDYDDRVPDEWYARSYDPPALDRLTHLVLVDGRLVDLWTQPVRGTRWQEHADRFDAERRPAVVARPPAPAYEQALAWLRSLVGGEQPLADLTDEPLAASGDIPGGLPLPARRRWEEVHDLLDRVCRAHFDDPDVRAALRTALTRVWEHQPVQVTSARSAEHLAAGLLQAVGKANGLFGPVGPCTQKEVAQTLGLRTLGQTHQLIGTLRGFQQPVERPYAYQLPDLLPLGDPALLLAATRRDIVRWRDRAIEAQQAALP